MKRFGFLKGVCVLLSFMYSCTSVEEDNLFISKEINEIVVTLPDSPLDINSRTQIDIGKTVTYTWAEGDTIGIFPDKGYQVAFDMSSAAGDAYAKFTGGGWALKGSSKYAAYYPFNYNNRQSSKIPIDYSSQVQKGNKNTDLVGNYNYMVATASTPTDGSVDFNMERLGRLVILKFNVPEPTILQSVKLVASDDVFTIQGYVNLWNATPSIVPTVMSKELEIELKGIMTTSENEEVTVYFFIAPIDLSNEQLIIEATDQNGNIILSTVQGKDMRDSKAYALTGTSNSNGIYEEGVVYVTKAGTMKKILGTDYLNITSLKVVGQINGDDVYYLRKMAGASYFSEAERGNLTTLDLSEATIVGGGEWYYEDYNQKYYTSKNVIGSYMFTQCTNLQHIVLPQNITSIGAYVFLNCTSLLSVGISEGITSIGMGAFYECRVLKSLNIPNSVNEIGRVAFYGCNALSSINIPHGITLIDYGTFQYCNSLSSITIPITVTAIGDYAFGGCTGLKMLTIPDAVITIGRGAFDCCRGLVSITIGRGVTSIGKSAFYECSSLSSCYSYATTPPYLVDSSVSVDHFGGIKTDAILRVPERCGNAYKESVWNRYFSDILEMD